LTVEAAVVAVSGGADSVALLRMLHACSQKLIVAHVNHQLRGDASDADAAFVEHLATSLGLHFRGISIDVAGVTQCEGGNLEANARKLRYDWLLTVARESQANWIATGHTADDQIETVLHRLIRGTGLNGLAGIRAERTLADNITLVRPMLHLHHAELIDYLKSLPQAWREDATNTDLAFTRNRIRHELLPLMRSINPQVDGVLLSLSADAAIRHRDQRSAASRLLRKAELPLAGKLRVFDATLLKDCHADDVIEMFRMVWESSGWPMDRMTRERWHELVELLGERSAVTLPGEVLARRNGRVIQIGPA